MRRRLCRPFDWLDWADDVDPGKRADQADNSRDGKRPEEMAGAIDEQARQRRRDDASKIADEILEPHPFAACFWPCHSLRGGENIWIADAIYGARRQKKRNR